MSAAEAASPPALADAQRVTLQGDTASGPIPSDAGVYAVYDSADALQYIGLTRKVRAALAQIDHVRRVRWLTQLCCAAGGQHRDAQAEPGRAGTGCAICGHARGKPRGAHRGMEVLDAGCRCGSAAHLA